MFFRSPKNINWLSHLLALSGLSAAYRRLNLRCGRMPVVTYHSITDKTANDGQRSCLDLLGMTVPKEIFIEQLRYITRNYSVVPLDQMIFAIKGKATLPRNAITITFDDGLMDNHTHVLPILKKFKCSASFFIISDALKEKAPVWPHHLYTSIDWLSGKQVRFIFNEKLIFSCEVLDDLNKRKLIATFKSIGKKLTSSQKNELIVMFCRQNSLNYDRLCDSSLFMQKKQLKDIHDAGNLIGAHSKSHEDLVSLDYGQLDSEVRESMQSIVSFCRNQFFSFAYPYGTFRNFNSAVIECLQRYGFICGLTTVEGLNGINSDPFLMKRIEVGAFSTAELSAHLSGAIGDCKTIMRKLIMRE